MPLLHASDDNCLVTYLGLQSGASANLSVGVLHRDQFDHSRIIVHIL